MNRKASNQSWSTLFNRLIKSVLLCGGVTFAVASPAVAANASYINTGTVNYPLTTNSVPNIDASNFVNSGSFTIDFISVPVGQSLYETHDTVNYTNTGTMASDTGFLLDDASSSSNLRALSATVFNSGEIECSSTNDLNSFVGDGGFNASATNIISPGTVDVGENGVMVFNGENVNLSGGTLIMEGPGASASGFGSFGTNIWNPDELTSTTAACPIFSLPDSTPFIDLDQSAGGSNNVYRAVFIEDFSASNVSYGVYFNVGNQGFGPGNTVVQWAGTYVDNATGKTYTNYLYLNNDYQLGASTNVALNINGVPSNLIFNYSQSPLLNGYQTNAAGFQPVFPAGVITNFYSFGDVQLLAGSESTNEISNGALTNFEGRVQIFASNELNLASAQIVGANYLSVQSPHQFDGSPGALIQSPYSDLNLGVTNGFLSISNLLDPQVPDWSGIVLAWDTEWIAVNNGITNDFRVLLVASQLTPTTLAQVQNLLLHGTNTIVVSDALNVMSVATGDAQNLILTTNGPAGGATSIDGEINVLNPNFAWNASFPNLQNLTNNGAIRLQSVNQFIAASNSMTITPGTPETSATGTLVEIAGHTNISAQDTVTVGFNQYTFVNKLTNSAADQVLISPTFNGSMSNFIAAINLGSGSGTIYSTNTTANPLVTAGPFITNGFTVTARETGPPGNSVAIATTSANVTWGGNTTLLGGANPTQGTTNTSSSPVWYQNFINFGLLSDQGSSIWADNFLSSGTISNGINSFALQSITATLTNGLLNAGGDISIAAESLTTSNLLIQSGRSLTLQVTNFITDSIPYGPGIVVSNGNIWVVGGASLVGLNLPIKPAEGDLLGTTITNTAPENKRVINTWAAQDLGASAAGFSNNAAIGRLILDASTNASFVFDGPGISNALYVDDLEFVDQATNRDDHGNPTALTNNANLVIYYAQAYFNGISVAELLNHENNDHLRWVPAFAGHYSSTPIVYDGATNYENAALASSPDIDSNGNGIPNAFDPEPFYIPSQVDFAAMLTNVPPLSVKLQWQTLPEATNLVQYTTNLLSGGWTTLTNFNSYYYGAGTAMPGVYTNGFISPQSYPGPYTNVWVYDVLTNSTQRYYRVVVNPNSTLLYGP